MRIDSIGMYNNRGLVPSKSFPKAAGNVSKPKAAEPTAQAGAIQKVAVANKQAIMDTLSIDESAQIRQLFGKFDLEALSQSAKSSDVDSRPGRFIDITV
ncbi:MAG: hypothetical protein GY839_16440 [candidate division Zixibacteria bacterium]|nr:hypothetical protein [candidate division Zixibacteria bacterium]